MQLEAIYDRGKLSFAQPVKLRNDHVRLVVNVPDDELVLPSPNLKRAIPVRHTRSAQCHPWPIP